MGEVAVKRSSWLKKGAVRSSRGRKAVESSSSELFDIELPARAEHLGKARQALATVVKELHLTTEDACDLLLAVGEACNNAVQHGNSSSLAALQVRCRLDALGRARKARALHVEIENSGNGFLPAKTDAIFSMPQAEDLAGHGRGLPLMRHLMDDVQISCENGNTVVHLIKKVSR